jgi:hypothetical protein
VENVKVLEVAVGEIDDTWKKYELYEAPILYATPSTAGGGYERSPYKAIIKGGQLVCIVGSTYRLLPNEYALEVVDEVAKEVGAEPMMLLGASGHVLAEGERRIHAFYSFDEISVGDERIKLGFVLHNGIDGRVGFGFGGFTFRHLCSNCVWFGFRRHSSLAMTRGANETLALVYRKHTKGFDIDRRALRKLMYATIDKTRLMGKVYEAMMELNLTFDVATAIREVLPLKLLPSFLRAEPLRDVEQHNLWDAYNEITANIWHNPRATYVSKDAYYRSLHAVLADSLREEIPPIAAIGR